MVIAGQLLLIASLILSIASAVVLFIAYRMGAGVLAVQDTQGKTPFLKGLARAEKIVNLGFLGVFLCATCMTAALGIILYAFLTDNFTIQYVAHNYPKDAVDLKLLFQISGMWSGREGSLLFWAWLIAVFATWVAWRRSKFTDLLSTLALGIIMIVVAFFLSTLVFSQTNNPFIATDPQFLDESGKLIGVASAWGMNRLLEHWAMALHPPTLFVGYAGMTVAFAYAIASLISGDLTKRWVELSNRITLFAWIFLSLGIGLGAVWAYVVLGWGGYWGWDAVENASLLSWLVSTALLHSYTAYRKRNTFRMWSYVTATFSFVFVVLGTFITRSGIVQSVHAFASDPVSTFAFMGLMAAALLACALGIGFRRNQMTEDDDTESVLTRNGTYYLTNVILLASAVLVAYMTLSSALPAPLPLAGQVVNTGAYNAVARPVGVIFVLMMALCPLLGWVKTDAKAFRRSIVVPAIASLAIFAALVVFFVLRLIPIYESDVAAGGDVAAKVLEQGPAWYYYALALLGFFAGSLAICTSLALLVRGIKGRMASGKEGFVTAFVRLFVKSPATAGGFVTHLGVGIIVIGLVASSMFVLERTINIAASAGATYDVGRYTLVYQGENLHQRDNGDAVYEVSFTIKEGEKELSSVSPSIEIPMQTMSMSSQKLNASVATYPAEDVFVVFRGLNADKSLSVDVKINPLILLVWIGFGILVVGGVLASVFPRARRMADDASVALSAAMHKDKD